MSKLNLVLFFKSRLALNTKSSKSFVFIFFIRVEYV